MIFIVLVYNKDKNSNNIETKIIKSKDIICPECKENILINIKDYRINLNECKNNHSRNNIKLEEYENTQKIDLSKIKCDKCNKYNNSEFYVCYSCNIILCTSCKINHNIVIILLIIMIKIIYVINIINGL